MGKFLALLIMLSVMAGCGAKSTATDNETFTEETVDVSLPAFNSDSAYQFVSKQVEFGPRVPNTPAHEAAAAWLASELKRHGAEVTEQKADLKAFDGTVLKSTNIMGSFNPEKDNRLLLLAHYDTRPWADEDADPANHKKPIDGANDGASGVGVLLELARVFNANNPGIGIDILFVDAEDYGVTDNDESWAMGTRYFAQNPIKPGYKPSQAILLDMVGGKDAVFPKEYFSMQSAPSLDAAIRSAAAKAGHADRFPDRFGSAVTDDHVELIKAGIPSVDILDFRTEGFAPTWHTMQDNMQNIDKETLKAVGETIISFIYQ